MIPLWSVIRAECFELITETDQSTTSKNSNVYYIIKVTNEMSDGKLLSKDKMPLIYKIATAHIYLNHEHFL